MYPSTYVHPEAPLVLILDLIPSAAWTPSLALVLVSCIHAGLSHVTIHLLTCLHDCVLLDSITALLVPHGKRSGFKHTLFLPRA